MIYGHRSTLTLAVMSLCALLATGSAGAVTLLQTDFSGTTVAGANLNGITYTTSVGISGPTTLATSAPDNLHNTAATVGYFAPNRQVNNSQWDVDIPLTVASGSVQVTDVVIDRQGFNVSGAINNATNKTYPIIVTLTGPGGTGTATVDPNPWPGAPTSVVN